MPDIVCPECGQVSRFVAIRRAAEEFCAHCDYPLFWAPTAVAMATPGVSSATTLRRLPGAGGRQRIGTRVCHECGELNALERVLLHPLRRRSRSEARAAATATATASAARAGAGTRAARRGPHAVVVVGDRRGTGDRDLGRSDRDARLSTADLRSG